MNEFYQRELDIQKYELNKGTNEIPIGIACFIVGIITGIGIIKK